jgi:hypothetical protein
VPRGDTFFLHWLELWKGDVDLPLVHQVIGCHKEDKDQRTQTVGMHAFLTNHPDRSHLSIVWFDSAPWAVTRYAIKQAAQDSSVLYVWGVDESFTNDTPVAQLAPILAPLRTSEFVNARPRLVALISPRPNVRSRQKKKRTAP